MPTPFPGMDPYLEHPALWPNVHASLIIALRDELAPRLRPRYYVAVEERVVRFVNWGFEDLRFDARPDPAVVPSPPESSDQRVSLDTDLPGVVTVELPGSDEVRERFLEIRDTTTDQMITVVELLLWFNKSPGERRRLYEQRRLALPGSLTHLVEIDLQRDGRPMPMRGYGLASDYRILVSRAKHRPRAELLPFSVRQPIPAFQLPLAADEAEPRIDLNQILHTVYDRAGYDLRIDYRAEPSPPLAASDAEWADALLRKAGPR